MMVNRYTAKCDAQSATQKKTLYLLPSPAYMLHQYEEHDNDRFRAFMNHIWAGGSDVLTLPAVSIVNVPGV
jgi:hypothetical protein